MLDLDTWQMLQRGNTADPGVTKELLGREPRRVSEFTSRWSVEELRVSGMMAWLQLVLRISLAAVWLVAGVVSMGVYPVEESYELLARVGITGGLRLWHFMARPPWILCLALELYFYSTESFYG